MVEWDYTYRVLKVIGERGPEGLVHYAVVGSDPQALASRVGWDRLVCREPAGWQMVAAELGLPSSLSRFLNGGER